MIVGCVYVGCAMLFALWLAPAFEGEFDISYVVSTVGLVLSVPALCVYWVLIVFDHGATRVHMRILGYGAVLMGLCILSDPAFRTVRRWQYGLGWDIPFEEIVIGAAGILVIVCAVSARFIAALRAWQHSPAPQCAACGYDMTGLKGHACPECGASGK